MKTKPVAVYSVSFATPHRACEQQERALKAFLEHPLSAPLPPQPFAHAPSFSVTSVSAHPIFGPSPFSTLLTLHLFSIAIMPYLFPEMGLYFIIIIVICK